MDQIDYDTRMHGKGLDSTLLGQCSVCAIEFDHDDEKSYCFECGESVCDSGSCFQVGDDEEVYCAHCVDLHHALNAKIKIGKICTK